MNNIMNKEQIKEWIKYYQERIVELREKKKISSYKEHINNTISSMKDKIKELKEQLKN